MSTYAKPGGRLPRHAYTTTPGPCGRSGLQPQRIPPGPSFLKNCGPQILIPRNPWPPSAGSRLPDCVLDNTCGRVYERAVQISIDPANRLVSGFTSDSFRRTYGQS